MITSKVIDAVMAQVMPGGMAVKIRELAAGVAVAQLQASREPVTAICAECGYAARGAGQVAHCPVCGAAGDRFRVVDRAVLEAAAARQGGASTEEPLPGITVRWAAAAREALRGIADPALRRRAQDRIEKHALSRNLPVITIETAIPLIEETAGRGGPGADRQARSEPAGPTSCGEALSRAVSWTLEAEARLARVPEGFMRDMTRQEIEKAARAGGVETIDLVRCEEWMAAIRATMCQRRGGRPEAGA